MRGSCTSGSFLPSLILLIPFSWQGTARGARERRIILLLWSEAGPGLYFIVLEESFYICSPLGEGLGEAVKRSTGWIQLWLQAAEQRWRPRASSLPWSHRADRSRSSLCLMASQDTAQRFSLSISATRTLLHHLHFPFLNLFFPKT